VPDSVCNAVTTTVNQVGGAKDAVVSTVSNVCARNPWGGDNDNGGCHTALSSSQAAGELERVGQGCSLVAVVQPEFGACAAAASGFAGTLRVSQGDSGAAYLDFIDAALGGGTISGYGPVRAALGLFTIGELGTELANYFSGGGRGPTPPGGLPNTSADALCA
jgi:hypothetical protein